MYPKSFVEEEEKHQVGLDLESHDWCFSLIDYVWYEILPENFIETVSIRKSVFKYYYDAVLHILYRKPYSILLCCLSKKGGKRSSRRNL